MQDSSSTDLFRRMAERARNENSGEPRGIAPDYVAKAIQKALERPNPAPRYRVGRDAKILNFLRWLLPDRLFDRLVIRARG